MAIAMVRFEDAGGGVRLDLQAGVSRVLAEFSIGDEQLEAVTLAQPPHGEIDVAYNSKIAEMLVPLLVQGTWAAMRDFHGLLATELRRATNILRYIPAESSDNYLIDTYRSAVPSLFNAGEDPSAVGRTRLNLIIRRSPELRGAAAYI
jgi:hypothetical protein